MSDEMKHTPEPWKVSECDAFGAHVVCEGQNGFGEHVVAKCWILPWDQSQTEANARRIVAAINMCSQFSTEDLERSELMQYVADLARRKLGLQKDRDELLSALKVSHWAYPNGFHNEPERHGEGCATCNLIALIESVKEPS